MLRTAGSAPGAGSPSTCTCGQLTSSTSTTRWPSTTGKPGAQTRASQVSGSAARSPGPSRVGVEAEPRPGGRGQPAGQGGGQGRPRAAGPVRRSRRGTGGPGRCDLRGEAQLEGAAQGEQGQQFDPLGPGPLLLGGH